MIDGLKPYRSYGEALVPWADRLPAHWSAQRGKGLFAESKLPVRDDDEIVTCFRDGQVTLRANRRSSGFMIALKEAGYQGVRRGQLVIHAMDAFAGAIGVSDSDGKCTPEYIVCNPRYPSTVPGYFARALRLAAHSNFIHVSCPAVRERAPRLRYPNFGDMLLPVPPPEEQAAIVRFLNHADRRLRRYIRAKQKLIKLLEEQKQAIIHQAVTRGLDPSVPMKDSGVEWLGTVPAHWEVKRLKWATRLQRGYDLPADKRVPGPFPVVSSGGWIDTHNEARAPGPGVVMGRYGSTGSVFFINEHFWPHNTSLFVTRFYGNLPKWCFYLLRSISTGDHSGKSAVPGVDRKDLFEIVVPIPPKAEQHNIVSEIENRTREVAGAIDSAQKQISLLRELRTRLIADVVTGQLDVRAAAAGLPNEPTDDEPLDDADEPDDLGADASPEDDAA